MKTEDIHVIEFLLEWALELLSKIFTTDSFSRSSNRRVQLRRKNTRSKC